MDEGRASILIVADDDALRASLVHQLVGHGHALQVLSDPDEALARLSADKPHVAIVGLALDGTLPLLERARAVCGRSTSLLVVNRQTEGWSMADALRRGADHCLLWPEQQDALALVVERAIEKPQLVREVERAREGILDGLSLGKAESIVGAHPAMQRLLSKVVQAAQSRATVLIHGETGTGKELIAAAVHQRSKRKDGPFVKLNCAALADTVLESELFGHEKGAFTGATTRRKGRFEQADGGTLFLDEVSEINPAVQVKLLRFLQEREFERVGGNDTVRVDVRIVAATNRNLLQLVEDGRFREDLYYRLNVVRLDVPPLRARPSDIALLAGHFLRRFAEENEKELLGFTQAATDALLAHPWPGNVRELENAVEQAVVLCAGDMVDVEDLPIAPAQPSADPLKLMIPGVSMEELERYAILRTLEACGNSPSRAAAVLGISRRTIQYRLHQWGLSRPMPTRTGRPEGSPGSEHDPETDSEAPAAGESLPIVEEPRA